MKFLAEKRKELSQTITSLVPSVKPNSDRRTTMKSGTRDQAEGKWGEITKEEYERMKEDLR
jgi:hypothetical protein